MRTSSLLVASFVAAGVAVAALPAAAGPRPADQPAVQTAQAGEFSAAKRKRARVYRGGYQAYGGNQIACTPLGCNPIPRGCWITTGRYFDGTPTGFDQPVCPYR